MKNLKMWFISTLWKSKRLKGAEGMLILLQNVKCVTMLEILNIVQIQLQNIVKVNSFKQSHLLNAGTLKLFSSCQAINSKREEAKGMGKLCLMKLTLAKIQIGLDSMKMQIVLSEFMNSNLKSRGARKNDSFI